MKGITEVDREVVCFDRTIPPACEVDAGSTVSFLSSGEILRRLAEGASPESIDLVRANAVTGPVEVRGAEPGDALRIEILDIAIDRAWAVWTEGLGPAWRPHRRDPRLRCADRRRARAYR